MVKTLDTAISKRYLSKGPNCSLLDFEITNLSDFLIAFDFVLKKKTTCFWFRGHGNFVWSLTPSALRARKQNDRTRDLNLVSIFKRYATLKIENPPLKDDELSWVQIAQHYGLPTRLLDWTENAAVALFFACQDFDHDGSVFVLNPIDLNKSVNPSNSRIFNSIDDLNLINSYLDLDGSLDKNGPETIAINPTWNSERITVQRGVFTLHGSHTFTLSKRQAPSLVNLPILKKHKKRILIELEHIGISEMSIFPELEHLCNWIKSPSKFIT